jgi:3-dehydroquinate synthase
MATSFASESRRQPLPARVGMTDRAEPVVLRIELGERGYPIVIGGGLINDPTLVCQYITARDVMLVTNETVGPLYCKTLATSLVGKRVSSMALPDGERHKTLQVLGNVFDALVAARLNRDACIVALGGGVIGDMAGFAAACYQRGVDFVQVPTTLLAQVDSSVGGKTGVNHPGGKNLIGAFYQPRAVITDLDTLATLAPRELRAGLAEIIKYGLIDDAEFLAWIERHLGDLLELNRPALAYAIRRSCEIKARIVAADEREQGQRALLNLGHTFGHAIETAAGYGEWLHGEGVAIGLLMAADMSRQLGWLDAADVTRVKTLLHRAQLPADAPKIGSARALELMGMDKKVLEGRIRLVLLRRLGQACITGEYPAEDLQATLRRHFEAAS